MCGRFSLSTPLADLEALFGLGDLPPLDPRYNLAPTQTVAVVRVAPNARKRELVWLKWGLVPSWAKDPEIGNRMINARSETVTEKPSFRAAFKKRRCLIPADGFYEWKRAGAKKQPYHIRMRDGKVFAMAGLWEHWPSPDGSPLETFTILTTGPNDLMRAIHDRMPVILDPKDYDLWLDPDMQNPEPLKPLLTSYPADKMAAVPIDTHVNNPKHEGPACQQQIEFPAS